MCEMLANKYLAEGELEKATGAFKRLLRDTPRSQSMLYSLLVCYAMQGRCREVQATARRLNRDGLRLDLAVVRSYRSRFGDREIGLIRNRLEQLCTSAPRHAALLNRLILAELGGQEAEAGECRRRLHLEDQAPAAVLSGDRP